MLCRRLAVKFSSSLLANSCGQNRHTTPTMTDANAAAPASTYVAGSASVAYVTAPDITVAKTLARGLIERKLAACVNIIPGITSLYMWQGELNEDAEVMMMIKTETQRIDDISQYIREHHPYKVAEVISVPLQNGNAPYMEFLAKALEK